VSLTADEYEEVRRVSTHFVVAKGHLANDHERLVRESSRYQVVEKSGVAGQVASRLDPRRRWKPHPRQGRQPNAAA
jgi:hypothetical protein